MPKERDSRKPGLQAFALSGKGRGEKGISPAINKEESRVLGQEDMVLQGPPSQGI